MAYDGLEIKMIDQDSFLLAHPLVRPCIIEMKDGHFKIVAIYGAVPVKNIYFDALQAAGGL